MLIAVNELPILGGPAVLQVLCHSCAFSESKVQSGCPAQGLQATTVFRWDRIAGATPKMKTLATQARAAPGVTPQLPWLIMVHKSLTTSCCGRSFCGDPITSRPSAPLGPRNPGPDGPNDSRKVVPVGWSPDQRPIVVDDAIIHVYIN